MYAFVLYSNGSVLFDVKGTNLRWRQCMLICCLKSIQANLRAHKHAWVLQEPTRPTTVLFSPLVATTPPSSSRAFRLNGHTSRKKYYSYGNILCWHKTTDNRFTLKTHPFPISYRYWQLTYTTSLAIRWAKILWSKRWYCDANRTETIDEARNPSPNPD